MNHARKEVYACSDVGTLHVQQVTILGLHAYLIPSYIQQKDDTDNHSRALRV